MLQRRSKHGWNEFSVENTEPIWKKYLDQVRIFCTDPHFLAETKPGRAALSVCLHWNIQDLYFQRLSLGTGCAPDTATAPSPGKTIVRFLCSSLRVQITSSNRNEPVYLPTAHKSNALDQGPGCWSIFVPFKASGKIMKGLRRASGSWKMLWFWLSLQKRGSCGAQGSFRVSIRDTPVTDTFTHGAMCCWHPQFHTSCPQKARQKVIFAIFSFPSWVILGFCFY